jgi:transposase-like protein
MPDPVVVGSLGRRRRFSDEFKSEIVAEALMSGKTLAQIARSHDLAQSLLHKWIRDAKAASKLQPVPGPSAFLRIEPEKIPTKDFPANKFTVRIRTPSGVAVEIAEPLSVAELAQLSRELGALS